VYISGVGYTTGSDPNGTFVIAGVATNTFEYTLTGADGAYTTTSSTTAGNITQNFRAITDVSYASDVVTITVTGHGLTIGEAGNLTVSDITFTGTDNNGVKAVTAATVDTLTFPVTGVTAVALGATPRITQIDINDAAASDVLASCMFSDPNESNKEYIIVALETLAKKIDLSTTPYTATTIPYPVGATVGSSCDMLQCFDKVMIMRDGQQALEWYPNGRNIISASQSGSTTVTVRVKDHGLTVGASVVISGLTDGTPPNGTFTVASIVDKDQFTFIGTTSQTVTFGVTNGNMADGFTLSPAGPYSQPQTFNANGLNIKALDGLVTVYVENNLTISAGDVVLIYEVTIPEFTSILNKSFQVTRATINEIEFYAPVPNYTIDVVSASQTNTTVTMVVRGHGFDTGDSIEVEGLTGTNGGTMPNGTQTVTSISGDQFTYTATAALPYYIIATPLNITATTIPSTGTVEVDIVGHGLGSSGWATISGYTGANSYLNGSYLFTRHNTNKLRFSVSGITTVLNQAAVLSQMTYNLTTTSATALNLDRESEQIEVGGRFSVGGGFMHQPGAPWATYFQRRLFVPFYYDQSGTFSAPVYTSRKISDEIAVSDLLDTTTFDQIENQFRITGGTADYVVAMHGFYEDALVVFNRNSIHLVAKTQGSLSDTVVKELTGEVGCLARKTVVMQANNMLFLADEGIYGLTFLNDYNLRGTEEPLSKNIQPYIDRINKNLAGNSVAVYFNNRYYIAVPLDSVSGGNDARGNNAVLIYNFLNKGWESLDTYGDSRFLIKNFITASAGVRNNLYAVSSNGGLHQIDASDSSVDRLSVENNASIKSAVFTGSISGATLTVTSVVSPGVISINGFIVGSGITQGGAQITAFGTGSGGAGTYTIDPPQSTLTSRTFDLFTSSVETPTINSYVTSRGYDFKTLERKRFTDAQVQMQNLAGETGEYDIAFATEDPDSAESIGTTTTFLGGQILSPSTAGEAETASIRCRLGGQRGYTGTITLTRTIGSPKIHSIQVAGSITNRQILSQK
jgi:hypothetical protein